MIKISFKDKIFIGIVIFGMMAFLYNKITGNDKGDDGINQPVQVAEEGEESKPVSEWSELVIGAEKIKIRIADTNEKRYQGLSGVEALEENEGMLFVHPASGFHSYVMRDMKFDLDFVFIVDDEVVALQENVSKDFTGLIKGSDAYDKVLELKAGTVERMNLLVGERVMLN